MFRGFTGGSLAHKRGIAVAYRMDLWVGFLAVRLSVISRLSSGNGGFLLSGYKGQRVEILKVDPVASLKDPHRPLLSL